jgi:hypothetical protein
MQNGEDRNERKGMEGNGRGRKGMEGNGRGRKGMEGKGRQGGKTVVQVGITRTSREPYGLSRALGEIMMLLD